MKAGSTRPMLFYAGVIVVGSGAVGALVFTQDLDTAAKAFTLALAMIGAAATLWRWIQRRTLPDLSTPDQLNLALEALAETLESQWRGEAGRRGLDSPAPVRMTWEATRRPVTDRDWTLWAAGTSTVATPTDLPEAARGGPVGEAGPVEGLPDGQHGSPDTAGSGRQVPLNAGVLGDIRDLFERRPKSRLVIIGAPGTGKTAAAILLLLDSLAHRRSGGYVPALITLSWWDAENEPLADFVARQLARDHPYLANPAYGGSAPVGLVTSGRVMPILDGLDETPEAKRADAVAALNRCGLPRLILTSRTDEYQQATEGQVVAGAAVVELLPVDLDAAIQFLSEGWSPHRMADWERVFTAMREQPEGPLRSALTTPLMLSLARQVYAARSPVELLEPGRFTDRAEVEAHLLDGFVPELYADRPEHSAARARTRRYPRTKAIRWLGYVAGQAHRRQTFDLAWWRVPLLVSWPSRASASMVLFALVSWLLTGLVWGGVKAFGLSLAAVPVIAYGVARRRYQSRLPLRFGWVFSWAHVWRSLKYGIQVGLISAAAVSIVLGAFYTAKPPDDASLATLSNFLTIGLVIGAVVGPIAMIGAMVSRTAPTVVPAPEQSFRAHFVYLLAARLFPAVVVVAVLYVSTGREQGAGITAGATLERALTYGVLIGLVPCLAEAGGQYLVTVTLLAGTGKVPWRFLHFLKDAHGRGVLRQQGATYQFRHACLQERLAAAGHAPAKRGVYQESGIP